MITLKINNLDKLQNVANLFPATAQKFIDEAIVKSIGEIARDTQPMIPVDTARLKNSFIPKFSPFKGTFGTNVVYANSVHDLYSAGTPYKHPSKNINAVAGFLALGTQKAQSTIQSYFDEALNKIVKALSW